MRASDIECPVHGQANIVQGVYGDKETTLARFRENYRTRLTDEMKAWVVLENDEVSCPRQPKLVIAT